MANLRRKWLEQFGIDIRGELKGLKSVGMYRCAESGLKFFHPLTAAGSSRLYQQLCARDWYYLREKWEYGQAAHLCRPGMRVLEVGCGSGEFLKKLQQREIDCLGLEINPAARERCQQSGLKVSGGSLGNLPARSFDMVCAFQVLEHLARPLAFLRQCVRVLRPGGILFLATPNADSFLLRPPPLLDMPPHHVTGWNESAYRYLENLMPLKLVISRAEPLGCEHVDWWVEKWRGRPGRAFFAGRLRNRLMPKGLLRWGLKIGARRWVKGQGMVAVFRRVGRPLACAGEAGR